MSDTTDGNGKPPDDDDDNTGTDNRVGADKKNGKPKEPSAFEKELAKGPVTPDNEELFDFLDGLFTGDGEFPERIEVLCVKGRSKDQYGRQIFQRVFKNDSIKPTRNKIVMLSNEIIRRIRVETDVLKRRTDFAVCATHHGRSAEYYATTLITMLPKKTWQHGERGDLEGDEDESMAERYQTKFLDHMVTMWNLHFGMTEGLLDRSDRQAIAAMKDNDALRTRLIEMTELNIQLLQAKDERAEKLADAKMWREQKMRGLDLAYAHVVPMLTGFKGPNDNANWKPGDESHEAYTLRESFFRTKEDGGPLTSEELAIICGKFADIGGELITPGILTIEQVALLAQVAKKEITPDALYDLLEGGRFAITKEQGARLTSPSSGVPLMALLPLKMLLDVLTDKQKNRKKGE